MYPTDLDIDLMVLLYEIHMEGCDHDYTIIKLFYDKQREFIPWYHLEFIRRWENSKSITLRLVGCKNSKTQPFFL